MTLTNNNQFFGIKKILSQQSKIIEELNALYSNLKKSRNSQGKNTILSQINSLKQSLKKTNNSLPSELNKINLATALPKEILIQKQKPVKKQVEIQIPVQQTTQPKVEPLKIDLTSLEKETIKRLKKKEKNTILKKERKANRYVQISNKLFSNLASKLLNQKSSKVLKSNLIKSNLQFLPQSYISVILFTTLLSIGVAFLLFLFFLFFNISSQFPIIIPVTEGIALRFVKVFWLIFVIPILTFIALYVYPSLEEKSAGNRIDQELPFAAIHMSSIAGSMIDPSKIFSIILTTKEYPNIEKEFVKLLNEINLLGYDLVTALRTSALNCPSKKLAELFNGLATTINSGGDLAGFFSKRAESLLFDYRIDREKRTRAAETFMDIYISVVIAAPMILMLLLMMMKISGLGLQLSTGMITLIMVLGVTGVNIGFLTFLHLKQSGGGE
jgi:hypothetical protein